MIFSKATGQGKMSFIVSIKRVLRHNVIYYLKGSRGDSKVQ